MHTQTLSLKNPHYWVLFFTAFAIRALIFGLYVQHDERYRQPDSIDYHNCSICLYINKGMYRPDKKEYVFWRTPGYPFYVSRFYKLYKLKSPRFEGAYAPQKLAIWVQIILNSFIPLLILFLAFIITNSFLLTLIAAWLSVFHVGLVLSSTYLLSEGLGIPFFILFLVLWFAIVRKKTSPKNIPTFLIAAALTLALFAWIRPMGQFVAVVSIGLYFLCTQTTFLNKLKHMALFAFVFWAALSPWYIRNYRLTNEFFFCPMLGAYLNTFNAPKMMRRFTGFELGKCATYLYHKSYEYINAKEKRLAGTGLVVCKEAQCMNVAKPILLEHPWWALYDWFKEVFKTTFDLYSSQLVNYAKNCFKWDPIEEFVTEKWHDCLFFPMHWAARLLVYIEVIFFIWLWIGLFGGLFAFMLYPLYKRLAVSANRINMCLLWWQIAPLIWACVFMTGGFGYARLRLPVEALMIVLALTFWRWIFVKTKL